MGSLRSTALSVSSTGRLLTISGSGILAARTSHGFRRRFAGSPRRLGSSRRTRSTAVMAPASAVFRSHRRGNHPSPHACLLLDPPEQSHPWFCKHLELSVRLIDAKMDKRLLLSTLHRCCSDLQPFHSNKDSFVRREAQRLFFLLRLRFWLGRFGPEPGGVTRPLLGRLPERPREGALPVRPPLVAGRASAVVRFRAGASASP